jgi:hypothetical protein
MPDPAGMAASSISASARSLHKASDVETALCAARRAARDMSGHSAADSTVVAKLHPANCRGLSNAHPSTLAPLCKAMIASAAGGALCAGR